jgi:MFS family permease
MLECASEVRQGCFMPAECALSAIEQPASASATLVWQAHLNAGLWGLGNGLVSTTLASYLARQLGAEGLAFGLIFASQHIAGGLRLFTPWILNWVGSRKWFAVGAFTISCLLLLMLPGICQPGHPADQTFKLRAFVALWGGWHLAMFVGAIALWSWIGDLVSSPVRGKFIGVRQSWLMIGQIAGMLAAAWFASWYPTWNTTATRWHTLSWPALAGGWCMLLAVLPLVWMPDVKLVMPQRDYAGQLWAAMTDRRFRPLLAFWCYAGLVNGVSQAVQGLYPVVVLKLPISTTLAMVAAMHLGQILLSPLLGYLADRGNSRTIMIVSQVLVSIALFFFPFVATSTADGSPIPYGMWFAHGLWIAYSGLNVCLPHLMLKLSPGENSPPYISTFYGLSGLAIALSSIVCGQWFDSLDRTYQWDLGALSLDRFELFLYLGAILRLTSVVWLCLLPREAATSAKIDAV